jgi:hypothetical protein
MVRRCIDYENTNHCIAIATIAISHRGEGAIPARSATIQSHDGIRILHSKHSRKGPFCVVKRQRA